MGEYWQDSKAISLLPLRQAQRAYAAAKAEAEAAAAASEEASAAAEAAEAGASTAAEAAAAAGAGAAEAEAAAVASAAAVEASTAAALAASAAAAAGAAAMAAAALAAGAAIGQGGAWLIHFGWDPTNPLYPTNGAMQFTSANDLEIDTCVLSPPFTLPNVHRIQGLDRHYPGFGTLLLQFLRTGIRTCVDAAQGVAAATVNSKAELKKAAAALKQDLKDYSVAINALADAIDYYPAIGNRLGKYSLTHFQHFIDLASIKSLPRLIDYEGSVMQQIFSLARVRSTTDIRPEIYAWLSSGIGPIEMDAFQKAPYQTLSFADVLRISGKCFALIDLSKSPLLK